MQLVTFQEASAPVVVPVYVLVVELGYPVVRNVLAMFVAVPVSPTVVPLRSDSIDHMT